MTIELFGHKDFHGNSAEIKNNVSDMKHTLLRYRASSMKLLDGCDKALLFQGCDWTGDVMWRHGVARVGDLGDFNNKVKSVRILPFHMKLKYHVIYSGKDLPGPNDSGTGLYSGMGNLLNLAKLVKEMHRIVHDVWNEYLIDLLMEESISWQEVKKYFTLNLKRGELEELTNENEINFPTDCVNVVLVDDVRQSRKQRNAVGVATDIGSLSTPVVVAEVISSSDVFQNARTIAHEIGHMFGLSHGGNCDPTRLMTQTGAVKASGRVEDAVHLSREEVETVHRNLAAHDAAAALTRPNHFDLRKG